MHGLQVNQIRKKLISKLSISPFSTIWIDKICIHQCFRYNAPWQLNLEGSKLYTDAESGQKIFEPARNDDRVNTHNWYILQLWRANVDWQPVLSRHAVIKYIAKYAAKAERSSETYQQMLMRLSNLENPEDLASRAYRKLLTETDIERDIGAQ